ncbi:MAG TPA: PASTA domain-containing protein, partial [Candidatus Binataceae bacterium]|nr:PASTA domain-containing protein [Candidatus Binataceae bacterium]
MRAIFISYRRNDTEGEAGRLFDDLVAEFGENSVFMDVTTIEAGRDFRKVIDESISTCGILLALIGKNWLDAKNDTGQRRLDDPTDFVRLETASALRRDIPVIPVIVRGATMPRPEQLPEDLRDLAYRNCVELTHPRWSSDLQLLIAALRRQLGAQKSGPVAPITEPDPAANTRQSGTVDSSAEKPTESPPATPVDTKKHEDERKRWPLFAAMGLVAIAAALAAYLFLPRQVTVPNVRGDTLADATAKLQASHLTVGKTSLRQDPTKDANIVLSQFPPSDEQVRRGSAVDLVISEQAPLAEVPAVSGKTLESARQELAAQQLVIGDVQRQSRAGVARDIVLQQFPTPGEMVKTGAKIDLLVSDIPPAETPAPATPTANKAADDTWAQERAAQRAAAKHAAALKAAADKAAADKLAADKATADKAAADKALADKAAADKAAADKAAADKAAADQAAAQRAQPHVSIRSATCTTVKPGQYRVDLAG